MATIEHRYEVKQMIVPLRKVVFGEYVREWGRLPYDGHPHGCPMYGTRDACPPEAPMFDELVESPFYLVIQEFDLEQQERKVRAYHPNWSKKMCRNPRYWQMGLTGRLLEEAHRFVWDHPELKPIVLPRPEANGVNLFSTCRIHGIKLVPNPQEIVKKMMMIGAKRVE